MKYLFCFLLSTFCFPLLAQTDKEKELQQLEQQIASATLSDAKMVEIGRAHV
jgi:hypothetical protein